MLVFTWRSPSAHIGLLVLLERMLLGLVALLQISIAIFGNRTTYFSSNLLGLGLFALLGWICPTRYLARIFYIILNFGLVLLLTVWGDLPLIPLLYIAIVIRGSGLFDRRDRTIVTAFSFIACQFSQAYRLWHQQVLIKIEFDRLFSTWIALAIVFGLVILFLQLLVDAILAERERQQQLTHANTHLRQFAIQVEELATLQERNRIAREIHDSLGHSLTVFNIHLEAALRLLKSEPQEAAALLTEVKDLSDIALQEVRKSVGLLRAHPLADRSLAAAISTLAADFNRSTNIAPQLNLELADTQNRELNLAIYRIVQESLTNIYKYAHADRVSIELVATTVEIRIEVSDNGIGFDPQISRSGFGLQGMKERTLLLGGKLSIDAAPDRGCRIIGTFPRSLAI